MPLPDDRALVAVWREAVRLFCDEHTDDPSGLALLSAGNRLKSALEESARDTKRLDWLERTAFVLSRYGAGRADIDVHPALDSIARETVRDAIDAARASAAVPDEAGGDTSAV